MYVTKNSTNYVAIIMFNVTNNSNVHVTSKYSPALSWVSMSTRCDVCADTCMVFCTVQMENSGVVHMLKTRKVEG